MGSWLDSLKTSIRDSFSTHAASPQPPVRTGADQLANLREPVKMLDRIDDLLNGKDRDPASLVTDWQVFPMNGGYIEATDARRIDQEGRMVSPQIEARLKKDGKLTGKELLGLILSDPDSQNMKVTPEVAQKVERAKEILRSVLSPESVKTMDSQPNPPAAVALAKFATWADSNQNALSEFIDDLHKNLTSAHPSVDVVPDVETATRKSGMKPGK